MYTLCFLETLLTYHTKDPKSLCYLFSQKFVQLFSAELLEEAADKENRVHKSEKHAINTLITACILLFII